MARYILIDSERGTILGQQMDKGGERPFVSIAEAYETLAKRAAREGTPPEEIGESFNRWVLHEIRRVEGN